MKRSLCLSVPVIVLLLVLAVAQVRAQSNYLNEYCSINIDCQKGTVDVSSIEDYSSVNGSTPVHYPSGANVTSMNSSEVADVTLTFSISNSTLAVHVNYPSQNRTIGDAWATLLSKGFQTNFIYDYTDLFGDFVYYKAAGKSNLVQFMQSLMSWCFAPDLNGFSPTFLQIAGKPGAYITVDTFPSSNNDWDFSIKCSYETSLAGGSGDHTIDVLNLLGVSSLVPSAYAGSYDSTYNTTVYSSAVDLTITSSGSVTYVSSKPPGLSTNSTIGVLPPRGWQDYSGSPGTSPSFHFENDSSAVTQLTYTFGGSVVPEFPSTAILSLFLILSTLAAAVVTGRFRRKIRANSRFVRQLRPFSRFLVARYYY